MKIKKIENTEYVMFPRFQHFGLKPEYVEEIIKVVLKRGISTSYITPIRLLHTSSTPNCNSYDHIVPLCAVLRAH